MVIEGKVAIITGGASGLGEACTRMLHKEGAYVAIFDIKVDQGEDIARELGKKAIYCNTDVTREESCKESMDKVVTTFGHVDILINCAGIAVAEKVISKKGLMSMENFTRAIQVNLIGSMNTIRLAVAEMIKNEGDKDREKGVIINTASIAAFEGQIGQVAYSASKGGIVGMTLPLAREFADYGVRVMTIAPGIFDTPMLAGLPEKAKASLSASVPFPKRLGKPEEYAQLAKHIIENPMLNGEVIRLDAALRLAPR